MINNYLNLNFSETLKILIHQGKQYIPDVTKAVLPEIFRGRPIITSTEVDEDKLVELCPTNAIAKEPFCIDLGKCTFCGICSFTCPEKIKFTNDHFLSTNDRKNLIIYENQNSPIEFNDSLRRKEIKKLFKNSLKLRQVSAGGDNTCEWELNACGNVNFDMGRFGIEFVASPRHADGIVITGPISENMAEALQICYDATPSPKVLILVGVDAISGGIFNESKAINRKFIDKYTPDLYIPGNPPNPLTIINGFLKLIKG